MRIEVRQNELNWAGEKNVGMAIVETRLQMDISMTLETRILGVAISKILIIREVRILMLSGAAFLVFQAYGRRYLQRWENYYGKRCASNYLAWRSLMVEFVKHRNCLTIFAVIKLSLVVSIGLGFISMNELKDLEHSLMVAPTTPETQSLYRKLLIEADVDSLKELKASKYDAVAVQAAWELCLLTLKDPDNKKIRRELINKHIGFLEGRLRVVVPNWWVDEIVGLERNDNTDFRYKASNVTDISCAPLMSMNEIDDVYRVTKGDDSVELPKRFLSEQLANGPWQVNCAFTTVSFYFAIHDSYGRPSSLERFDRESGISRWRSTVCGCSWGVTSGPSEHRVSIEEFDDRIAVFGLGSHGGFIQVFDAKTGDSLSLFSTGWSQE